MSVGANESTYFNTTFHIAFIIIYVVTKNVHFHVRSVIVAFSNFTFVFCSSSCITLKDKKKLLVFEVFGHWCDIIILLFHLTSLVSNDLGMSMSMINEVLP